MGNSSSYYLRVLLKLLSGITKLLAINEFQYECERELFVSSKFWHDYLKFTHYLFVFPLIWPAVKFFMMDRLSTNFDYNHIKDFTTYSLIFFCHLGIVGSGYFLVYRCKDLCQLLNLFSNLLAMHCQLFRRSVRVSSFSLVCHFLRELAVYCLIVSGGRGVAGLTWLLAINFGRGLFIYYLCDVAMLLHASLLRSLHKLFERPPRRRKMRRKYCLNYFRKLLQLREGFQDVSWISQFSRLVTEVVCVCWLAVDYMFNDKGRENVFASLVLFSFLNSNMLRVVLMAHGIHMMEQDIFGHFQRQDMFKALRQGPKCRRRKWSCLMLEQLHLKRCTLKQRSVNQTNFIFVRQSLLLEIFGFIFTNVVLLVSLTFKYSNIKQ